MIYATLLLLAIWLVSSFQFGTPVWLCILLAPVCMISEWPRLRYIDDNATMLLIPLALVLLLEPFALVMAQITGGTCLIQYVERVATAR